MNRFEGEFSERDATRVEESEEVECKNNEKLWCIYMYTRRSESGKVFESFLN